MDGRVLRCHCWPTDRRTDTSRINGCFRNRHYEKRYKLYYSQVTEGTEVEGVFAARTVRLLDF